MTRTTKDLIKVSLFAVAFLAALLVVGHSDYTDAVVSEMQNNGKYDSLADEHPEASDEELVEIYLEERE